MGVVVVTTMPHEQHHQGTGENEGRELQRTRRRTSEQGHCAGPDGDADEQLADPAYNLVVHSAPAGDEDKDYFQWHVQIVPRVTTPAGLELATGIPVIPTSPESLRKRAGGRRASAGSVTTIHRVNPPSANLQSGPEICSRKEMRAVPSSAARHAARVSTSSSSVGG